MNQPNLRANPSQLKNDIDRGATDDKIPNLDPAASPLGTDDEAAGTPVRPETLGTAAHSERERPERIAERQRLEEQPDVTIAQSHKGGLSTGSVVAMLALAMVVLAAVLWGIVW